VSFVTIALSGVPFLDKLLTSTGPGDRGGRQGVMAGDAGASPATDSVTSNSALQNDAKIAPAVAGRDNGQNTKGAWDDK
jgi:hypothetical protein